MKKVLITVAGALVLAGCVSPAQRIANCTASGVSYDTCYLSEQQRQQSINNASLSAAYANAARATETNIHTHHN
jgi:starvation-inducible outer membrane lipoprotein